MFSIRFSFCIFALLATQELQAAPYIYSRHNASPTMVTSQLLGTRTYNAEEELTSEGDGAEKLTNYTYNATGQLITTQDRDDNFIHHTYNDHEQLKTSWADQSADSTAPGGNATDILTPSYDVGNDQDTGASYQQNQSASTNITTKAYNLAGKLITTTYTNNKTPSDPKTQQYQYNLNGSTKSFTNVENQITNYTYTLMQELKTVAMNNGTTTYTYDPFGRKINETRPNGVQTTWAYDDYNGMKTITSTGASFQRNVSPQTLDQLSYTYDADGNIHTETIAPSNTVYTYQYNKLNQLDTFTCTGVSCPKDSNKKPITNSKYTYTLNNGIQSISSNGNTATYYYYTSTNYPDRLKNITNSNNNLNQSGTYTYDNNGNVTTNANGDTLTYDALNQMLSVSSSMGVPVAKYGYNGEGKLDEETPANELPIHEYYGGNGKVVTAKIQGDASVTYAMGTERIAQYYFEKDPTKSATSTQYYLYDQRGSVTNVLGVANDTLYTYSPFGLLSPSEKPATPSLENNTFGYIGQSLDTSTGLMMMGGYRAYDPAVGVFLKQDSYSAFNGAGTFNGFNYGAGNPVLFSDPTGHMPGWAWSLIGIGISIVASVLTAGVISVVTGVATNMAEAAGEGFSAGLAAETSVVEAGVETAAASASAEVVDESVGGAASNAGSEVSTNAANAGSEVSTVSLDSDARPLNLDNLPLRRISDKFFDILNLEEVDPSITTVVGHETEGGGGPHLFRRDSIERIARQLQGGLREMNCSTCRHKLSEGGWFRSMPSSFYNTARNQARFDQTIGRTKWLPTHLENRIRNEL